MSLYHHLTASDREVILLGVHTGKTQQEIADQIGCSKSTVNRELNRNGGWQNYSSTNAQRNYEHRRQNSRRPRLLEQQGLRTLIVKYIVEYYWSPEQIAARLRHENSSWQISYVTIYRGIYLDNLKVPYTSHGARGLPRRLRHRGKTRKVKGTVNERRGRFNAAPSIHERPASAEHRNRFGHWEGDTVRGKVDRSALVTLVDRKSRFLCCQRVAKANADSVKDVMIDCLSELPSNRVRTITPDRGSEFAKMLFPDAHSPQQRGANENTNGLIREYFPKGTDLNLMSDEEITAFVNQLNNRPRKVLGWRTPSEVFMGKKLHLI
ncbi:IS30 family transposase [Lactiplantibacillus plantarum]|uniref:IS30 family transposase n=1 Tax=Lactiplantibacillus plantarum TaxID=1590 RepID=UPI0012FAA8BD|nr:IS30 family transposase [Lactiplantibacillus plantarum]KAE9504084.1 IS30 family transposase ISApl1 [Lactiplantibacillus plantarum]